MTIGKSLVIVSSVFVLGVVSTLLVIFRLHPYSAPNISITSFFISFFFFVSSFFTLVGFTARYFTRRKDEEFYNPMNVSLRQGVLLGLCVSGLAGFQIIRTLGIWEVLLLVSIIVLVEVYFMARERLKN
jgi:hypothetical protein